MTEHRIHADRTVTQINVGRALAVYLRLHGTLSIGNRMEYRILQSGSSEAGNRGDFRLAEDRLGVVYVVTADDSLCTQWLRRIDDALSSTSGAMLTLDRFDEVMRLRRQVREFWDAGRIQEARLAAEAAMDILSPRVRC